MQDSHKVRFIGSVVVSCLLSINFFAASYLEPSGFTWWLLPLLTLLILLIWEWNAFVGSKLDKRFPWSGRFGKRLALQLLFTCLGALLIFNLPYSSYKLYAVHNLHDKYTVYIVLLVNSFLLIFCLLVMGMQLSLYFLNKWKNAKLESEQYKKESLKAQLDALKSQINPHFLFNNMNTLYGLIQESPEMARQYLLQLSDIYRYILASREQEAVPLEKEVKVAKAYLFLLQNRYEEALQVEWQLPSGTTNYFIVPLTLQMLIENAVKHNSFDSETPLRIRIKALPGSLLEVWNSVNKRSLPVDSTRVGLRQLRQQYQYLSDAEVEVCGKPDEFSVKIPLLTMAV